MRLLNLGCGQHYHSAWVNVDFRATGPGVMAHELQRGIPFAAESFDAVYHSHLLEHFPKRRAPAFVRECFRVLKPEGILRVVVPDLEQIARLYLALLDKALRGDPEAQQRYDWIMLEMLDQMVRTRSGGDMRAYWKQNPMPAEAFVIERYGSQVLNALSTLRDPSRPQPNLEEGTAPIDEPDATQVGRFRLSGEVHQWMYDRYSLGALLQVAGFRDGRVCRADESDIPDFNAYLLDIEADGSVRKPDSLFMEARK
jgi:predicted SAM-dependent methyltransferase